VVDGGDEAFGDGAEEPPGVLGGAARPTEDLVISGDRVVGRFVQAAAEIRDGGEERGPELTGPFPPVSGEGVVAAVIL
jgi:hypothetical protein